MDLFKSISPIDGRYRKYTEPLAAFFSEAGLMRYRVRVEVEYLMALSDAVIIRNFNEDEKKLLRERMYLSDEDLAKIKEIEGITNHDVKAIEYFLREKLKETTLADCLEFIHFALTSEDVDNISRSLGLRDGLEDVLLVLLDALRKAISELAEKHKSLPMLARTHGQPATPTTFGKEFKVFAARLERQIRQLRGFKILVKLNGASGNYNAHTAAYPNVDWIRFSRDFVESFNYVQDKRFNKEVLDKTRTIYSYSSSDPSVGGESRSTIRLEVNLITTQIEPHDSYAELFDCLRRINTILIDFNQDAWRYISDGWIAQKPKEGEVGSSTMPHKINPIKFENSEGNLGMANALFEFFSRKLPVSRLQRDLSDSTVERNFGVAFAHSAMAYASLLEGLDRITVNEAKVREELNKHPEVIAEAIQTILRRENVMMPYEKLKELTRGRSITIETIHEFIDSIEVSDKVKEEMKAMTAENHTGLARVLAEKNPS